MINPEVVNESNIFKGEMSQRISRSDPHLKIRCEDGAENTDLILISDLPVNVHAQLVFLHVCSAALALLCT